MNTRDLGQLLFVGFDGVELSGELRGFLSRIRPGGIILFSRNLVDPDQVMRLTASLREICEPRPLLAVDEEGGRVSRLRSMTPTLPPAAALAARGNPELVRDLAERLGAMLATLGFDIDFTPVVDLCGPEATNGVGDRSFGEDPEQASILAGAVLDGLARAGVTGCLKHFPGLGPTTSDSHLHLPTATRDEQELRRLDLVPYHRLKDSARVVMIGHGHYPGWAGPKPLAATLVPRIATDLLRREVGFEGLALADDLEMKAVADHVPYEDLAPRVLVSGCDMALVCRHPDAIERSLAGLRSWAQDGRLPAARIDEAFRRLDALRAAALRPEAGRETFASARDALASRLTDLA
ncbi:MAG: beta-N-acetylhexosaminidase [Candidatus Polarisedimenticolia bacterium]